MSVKYFEENGLGIWIF